MKWKGSGAKILKAVIQTNRQSVGKRSRETTMVLQRTAWCVHQKTPAGLLQARLDYPTRLHLTLKKDNHVQIDGVYVLDKEGSLTEMATFGVGFMKQELGLMPF